MNQRKEFLKNHMVELQAVYEEHAKTLRSLYDRLNEYTVRLEASNGEEKTLPVGQIIRVLRPNDMGIASKIWTYLANIWTCTNR